MNIVYSLNRNCFRCKQDKSILEFTVNEYNKSGFSSWCKSCYKEYRAKEREDIKSDPVKLERQRKWNREYYHQNKERIKLKALTK